MEYEYQLEIGDTVVCNPALPPEVFKICNLPTDQSYTVMWSGPDPDGEGVYLSLEGEDGETYEYKSSNMVIKKATN